MTYIYANKTNHTESINVTDFPFILSDIFSSQTLTFESVVPHRFMKICKIIIPIAPGMMYANKSKNEKCDFSMSNIT